MTEPIIRIDGLYKEYITEAGPVPVLKDISLSVMPGEFVAIMGPSGSGKSTFMNILGCLDIPTHGSFFLTGKNVGIQNSNTLAKLRNQVIGFVFQGYNLLPRTSLLDNVALPLIYSGVSGNERSQRAAQMLNRVGLGQYLRSRPTQISGGQQQRVAIARALVNQPQLIFADEPTGNLDTHTSYEIMTLFSELNQRDGITIVLVTHEPDIAIYAKRLIRLEDGRIVYDGPVQDGLIADSPGRKAITS